MSPVLQALSIFAPFAVSAAFLYGSAIVKQRREAAAQTLQRRREAAAMRADLAERNPWYT